MVNGALPVHRPSGRFGWAAKIDTTRIPVVASQVAVLAGVAGNRAPATTQKGPALV